MYLARDSRLASRVRGVVETTQAHSPSVVASLFGCALVFTEFFQRKFYGQIARPGGDKVLDYGERHW